MEQKNHVQLVALSVVVAAYIFQVVNIWRVFETRFLTVVPAVLIHVGVILSIIALSRKARKEPVSPRNVLSLAIYIFASWFVDLSLISRFAVR
jgi:hypothetical protein